MKVKAGTIITIEAGEYDDFRYDGPFVVAKDFDQREVATEFENREKPDADRYCENIAGLFVTWLVRNGYIQDIDGSLQWYIGAYEFYPIISDDKAAA